MNEATDQETTDQETTDQETTDQETTDQETTDLETTDQETTDLETTDLETTDLETTDQTDQEYQLPEEVQQLLAFQNQKIQEMESRLNQVQPSQVSQVPDDVQNFLTDFPDFQNAFDYLMDQREKQSQEANKFEQARIVQEQKNFENSVAHGYYNNAGAYVPGILNAQSIVQQPAFQEFANTKAINNPMILQSSDPGIAINLIKEFQQTQNKKSEVNNFLTGNVGKANSKKGSGKNFDPEAIFTKYVKENNL